MREFICKACSTVEYVKNMKDDAPVCKECGGTMERDWANMRVSMNTSNGTAKNMMEYRRPNPNS